MRQVHTSSLNEIKTVFNSDSDNEQYYSRLKNSSAYKINNVELARPIIRRNNATIIWKADTNLELRQFNELSDDKQAEISFKLSEFFNAFKEKINSFRNIPSNFADQLIQIPNKNSLLVNEQNDYIVIVNWGYLEDAFDPKNDVISKLFAKARSSILVKLINKKGNPISNIKLTLESKLEREFSTTDKQGYARFGTLETGNKFSIYETLDSEKSLLATFECDGRKEYRIIKNERIDIKLKFKNQFDNPVSNEEFTIVTNEFGSTRFHTDALGQHSFSVDVDKGDFKIRDKNNNKVFSKEIPDDNATFEITIEEPKVEEPLYTIPELDNGKNITLRFVNSFGNNLKNLNVNFESKKKNYFSATTNNEGEIRLTDVQDSNLTYSFQRYKKTWRNNLIINDGDYHIVKVKPIFPWLWWIIIAILFFLLICCLFFNCFCNNEIEEVTPPKEQPTTEVVQSIPCNTHNESGREGVTTNQHYLGDDKGIVYIKYDMMGVPDKLEVFYEGKLVASTHTIPNNVDGFVGSNNGSGCCGTLQFNYKPNKDDFCTVIVTGPRNTAWNYVIDCPR